MDSSNKKMLSWLEYFVLITVMICILKWGFVAGVFIGILIGCITFAYGASRVNVIKYSFDGSEYRSSLDRSLEELDILVSHKKEILGIILQSYLFFGSTNNLYEFVKKFIFQNKECRYLIFDFKFIHGLDSSALHSFRQIKRITDEQGVRLLFSNLSIDLIDDFSSIVSKSDSIIENLDKALEICENGVIENHIILTPEDHKFISWLEKELGSFDLAERLAKLCQLQNIKRGDVIATQDMPADCMHFILSGRLSVTVKLEDGLNTRVRSLGNHTTVGEMGILTMENRSATVIAEENSIVYQFDKKEFDKIKKDDPELCEAFLTYVIMLLSKRLRIANNTIAVLRR